MSLKDLLEAIGRVMAEYLTKRSTGQITIKINLRQGGIANASVVIDTPLLID